MKTLTAKELYINECAASMIREFHGKVEIRITAPGNLLQYPAGTWFDDLVGNTLEAAGVDMESIPPTYIMPNGDGIPFNCARVILVRNGVCPVCSRRLVVRGDEIKCARGHFSCPVTHFVNPRILWKDFPGLCNSQLYREGDQGFCEEQALWRHPRYPYGRFCQHHRELVETFYPDGWEELEPAAE